MKWPLRLPKKLTRHRDLTKLCNSLEIFNEIYINGKKLPELDLPAYVSTGTDPKVQFIQNVITQLQFCANTYCMV